MKWDFEAALNLENGTASLYLTGLMVFWAHVQFYEHILVVGIKLKQMKLSNVFF